MFIFKGFCFPALSPFPTVISFSSRIYFLVLTGSGIRDLRRDGKLSTLFSEVTEQKIFGLSSFCHEEEI
jgi:hypothetical protein